MKDGSYKLDPLKTFEFLKTQSKENKVTVTIINYFKMFVIVIKKSSWNKTAVWKQVCSIWNNFSRFA